ncbi:hypothetical protein E4G67_02850 [Candidatus Bathyarchaeota archaeon]|nr:MAG: hypothetical protein E4G67_02850 [Candidatus Bathyarchaeota archaeon]
MNQNKEKNKVLSKAREEQKQFVAKAKINATVDPTKAINLEDKIELDRREAYIEPNTRDLLRIMLQYGDNNSISPIYSSGLGYIYQIEDRVCKGEINTLSKDLLLNLAKLDILTKSFADSVASCPNCESIILTFHNRCPKCKSHNIDKSSLTEHIPCGLIEQREKYVNDRCPKCGEFLVEGKYRNMGRWYVCQSCEDRFENPAYDLICHNCNTTFTIKESTIKEIPKFSLNPKRKKEIRQNVASLEDIKMLLSELGFSIEIPGLATGLKSGMQHHFSLIAKKLVNNHEVVIALDHATSESEVQVSPLILYIYKTSEVKVDIPIFIAIPNLNETAKKIAQGHEILVIEGLTEEINELAHIKAEIGKRLDEINEKIALATIVKPENKPGKSFFGKIKGITMKAAKENVDNSQQDSPTTSSSGQEST